MINKRLLIKNLLAHSDENSFYDKKLKLNLGDKEGKAKFLKHVCALSNSNPANNSYILIGVDDRHNEIVGVDFFDDAKLQNLINAYLENAPQIQYENIALPHLPADKVLGLVTIRPRRGLTALRKNIWKYYGGTVFMRDGSISMPKVFDIEIEDHNSAIVTLIEQGSSNNISSLLHRVTLFMELKSTGLQVDYRVFMEQFVICWSGKVVTKEGVDYYSRVNIELVNEQVRLFYSKMDEVTITCTETSFTINEYIELGMDNRQRYHPLERKTITFHPNGTYDLSTRILFNPPYFDRRVLHHVYNGNLMLLNRIATGKPLTTQQEKELARLPETMMICRFNNVGEPIQKMKAHKEVLKDFPKVYRSYKEVLRILRKVKYNS